MAQVSDMISNLKVLLLLAIVFLASCASPPAVVVEPEVVGDPEPEVVVDVLEQETPIEVVEAPDVLVDRARNASQAEAIPLLLAAVSGFIDSGQLATAQIIVSELGTYPLDAYQSLKLEIQRAELYQARQEYQEALVQLSRFEHRFVGGLEPEILELYRDFLRVSASAHAGLSQWQNALDALLARDELLDRFQQIDNQKRIVDLIRRIDPFSRASLEPDPNDRLIGWLALVDILENLGSQDQDIAIRQWREMFPLHSAQAEQLSVQVDFAQFDIYQHIAVLLPMTSPFGSAAQAFYDGFLAARDDNLDKMAPHISLHDVGADPVLSSFYYHAAVSDGADFVVGPLGRKAVNEWLTGQQLAVPTLVVADIAPDQSMDGLFGISLSPEREAAAIAQKAFDDGHRNALVFRIDSSWGQRVADAFTEQWHRLGGTITKNSSFPGDISDYSRIIKKLLKLDKSEGRRQRLNKLLGRNLHFTPSRRDDMDFLFLASNADMARLVVPQLRFFQAHDLPIYATSNIYGAEPNPSLDTDLENVILGEMPWLLAGAERHRSKLEQSRAAKEQARAAQAAREAAEAAAEQAANTDQGILGNDAAQETAEAVVEAEIDTEQVFSEPRPMPESPYANGPLDRLYALGYTTYESIPVLQSLRANDALKHPGTAMTFGVDPLGNVVPFREWAHFRDGLLMSEKYIGRAQ